MSSSIVGQLELDFSRQPARIRLPRGPAPPRRSAPYEEEPGYFEPGGLWMYGNSRLLDGRLVYIAGACGPNHHPPSELDAMERQAEEVVLAGQCLVCGVHNAAHQRAAVVPLRWGAPRIVVVSGGFRFHLGPDLKQEPFRAARLWRYEFDARTDLIISRRAPDKKPTYASHNPTVDRLIQLIAQHEWPGLRSPRELLTSVHDRAARS